PNRLTVRGDLQSHVHAAEQRVTHRGDEPDPLDLPQEEHRPALMPSARHHRAAHRHVALPRPAAGAHAAADRDGLRLILRVARSLRKPEGLGARDCRSTAASLRPWVLVSSPTGSRRRPRWAGTHGTDSARSSRSISSWRPRTRSSRAECATPVTATWSSTTHGTRARETTTVTSSRTAGRSRAASAISLMRSIAAG